jgi:DNA polymerase elongation subunit (family B)
MSNNNYNPKYCSWVIPEKKYVLLKSNDSKPFFIKGIVAKRRDNIKQLNEMMDKITKQLLIIGSNPDK